MEIKYLILEMVILNNVLRMYQNKLFFYNQFYGVLYV